MLDTFISAILRSFQALGTPVRVDPVGTTPQPITGSVTVIGGGGGGPATIADGADTAEGTTTDAAVTTDSSGTLSGKVRGVVKIAGDVWDSGNHVLKTSVSNFPATQPVSGSISVSNFPTSVTANAGTNLNTSLLALESGGHLNSLDTKLPAQGQALAAASLPVVLPAAQITTLTPPTSVTANQGSANATPWNENLAQVGGAGLSLGQAVAGSSIPVVLPAAQITSLTPLSSVTVSGTVSVSNLPATQPVSGAVTTSPTTAGQQVMASSTSVVVASDQTVPADIRNIGGNPISLGPAVAVESLPVVVATDSDPIPVLIDQLSSITSWQGGTWNVNVPPAIQGSAPWIDNIAQVGGSPISLGSSVTAASLPVNIASDQRVAVSATDAECDVFSQILCELRVIRSAIITLACDGGRAQPGDFNQPLNPVDTGPANFVN